MIANLLNKQNVSHHAKIIWTKSVAIVVTQIFLLNGVEKHVNKVMKYHDIPRPNQYLLIFTTLIICLDKSRSKRISSAVGRTLRHFDTIEDDSKQNKEYRESSSHEQRDSSKTSESKIERKEKQNIEKSEAQKETSYGGSNEDHRSNEEVQKNKKPYINIPVCSYDTICILDFQRKSIITMGNKIKTTIHRRSVVKTNHRLNSAKAS